MIKEIPQNIPSNFLIYQTNLILTSYKKWTGKDLLPSQPSTLGTITHHRELFWSPSVVVTSNNEPEPLLNYGNQAGLDLWEMSWEKLAQTPGRKTAEAVHREERQRFLAEVQKNGFIDNYAGIRISSTGRRFKIENAIVWNLVDEKELFIGQAATFSKWHYV